MHEAGLMQTALELAFDRARQAGASRIHQMTLRVGMLSGVVPEALRMAFIAATPGTVADGATLVVDEIAVRCRCEQCGEEFWPEDIVYLCSNCGALNSHIEAGRELELTSLEVS
jgi:hydrogenase nickel incorporation protein HypA/HybF